MSEFTAKITAELDTSKVEQKINGLNGKKVKLDVDTGNAQKNIHNINSTIKSATKTASSFGDTLKKSFNIGATATITREGFQLIRTAANNAVEAIKDIDGAIVDLQMATGKSYNQVSKLVGNYNEMAKSLGATTIQVTEAADSWLRQGNSLSKTNTLIRDSMILSKVGQLDSAAATQYLTSSMKGYKVAAEDALGIVDKLAAVDLESATNAGGLAEAMSRTAVTASNAGISMDRLLGYLATVGETTQESMSTIGMSFKTIFTRMSDIKSEKLELIDEDGTSEILSDVEQTLANVGIDLRKTITEYNNYGDVLDNLAAKWDSLNQVQQNALAKAFAGTRQQNRFRVLMENYDNAKKYMDVAANSAGTAESKFSAYLDSLEAKLNSLQAAFESLVFNSSMTEIYSDIVEASTAVFEFLDNTKLLQGTLAGLATAGAVEGLKALVSGIQNSVTQMSNFGNALALLSSGSQVMGDDFQNLLLMTENLSKSQLKAVLSSEALSTEQRIAILTSQGMTTAQAEAALSSMGLATAEGAATASTVTLSSAVRGLWATLMANPLLLIITGVTVGTMAINALSDAAKEASEAADELKAKSMEEAQAAREEIQTLEELIAKYKELAESDTQDAGKREEIANVQGEIVDLVGQQAANLDLVNGKLDDEIDKLNQIRKEEADKAVESSVNAYHTAQESHDKAVGNSSGSFAYPALGSYEYAGARDKEAEEILWNADPKNRLYVSNGGWFGNSTYANAQLVGGAQAKLGLLNEWIDALKADGDYDYASSDFYNTIIKQRDAYQEYVNDMKKSAKELADAQIISSTYNDDLSKIDVNSLENYEEYRDKLVELVKNSPNLSEAISSGNLTDEDITARVDNYMATVPNYFEYYNQFLKLEEQKKKIVDVKKAFSDSDWVQDASWGIAEQRLNDFNDWFDKLSDEDKEIVYDISCKTDTAKFNLDDWQNALENYSAYTKQTADEIKSNLTRATESTKKLVSGISSAQDILSSQTTGTSLSIEDFNSDELADYRSALEYTNGTMQLNAEKVNEIVKAKSQEQIEINNTNKAMAQYTYLDNAAQIEKLRQKIKDKNFAEGESEKSIQNNIDALLKENGTIKLNCDSYDLMNASLQEATDSYHNWLNAQGASDYGDMANDAVSAIQRIRDTYDSESDIFRDFGSKKFTAAVDFIIPESVDPDDLGAIESYMSDFKKYLVLDKDGNAKGLDTDKFLSDAVDAGLMSYSKDKGFEILGEKKMDDFAEGLNLSSGVVQAFFDELQLKGAKFDWSDEAPKTLGDLAVEANEAAEKLRDVKGNSDIDIKMDISDLETTEEQVKTLDSTIAEMDAIKAKPNVDSSEIENANAVIHYCLALKQLLTQPDVMRVDTSKVSGDIGNAISLLQEFQRAQNDLEINKKIGADTTEAQKKVDELVGKIRDNSKTYIQCGMKFDATSSATAIQNAINTLDASAIVNLGIDASAITGYNPGTKECSVVYNPETSLLPESFDAVDRTVNYVPVTSDLPSEFTSLTRYVNYIATGDTSGGQKKESEGGGQGVNGTAHASGTAKIGGDWGTAKSGKTLVGELGREIVVDPRTGRWYTVGDNGAEFRDIPAGSIVFNHKQTESLLANGYVTGRATALAGGTAYVTGYYKAYEPSGSSSSSSGRTSSSNSTTSKTTSNNSKVKTGEEAEKALDKFNKYTEKLFDWIEIRLDRLQRKTDKYLDTAEKKVDSGKFDSAKKQYQNALTSISKQIKANESGKGKYKSQANSILRKAVSDGLISSESASNIKTKVADGTINISQYGEKMRTVIKEYQAWYDKAIECADNVNELQDKYIGVAESIANLPLDKAEAKIAKLEDKLDVLDAKENVQNTATNKNKVLDSKNKIAKQELDAYKTARKESNSTVNSLKKKVGSLIGGKNIHSKKDGTISTSNLDKNSKAYNAVIRYNKAIEAQKKATQEAEKASYEYTATLRENTKAKFDNIAAEYESKQSRYEAKASLAKAKIDSRSSLAGSQISSYLKNEYKTAINENKNILKSQEAEFKTLWSNYNKNSKNMSAEDKRDALNQINALSESIISTKVEIADLQDGLNNIEVKKLEISMDSLQNKANEFQDAISLKEAKGLSATSKDYNNLISNSKSQVSNLQKQNAEFKKQQKGIAASSEKYQELQAKINANNDAIREATKSQIEWNNAVGQLPYDEFEKTLSLLDAISKRIESQVSLKSAMGLDLSEEDYNRQIETNDARIEESVNNRRKILHDYMSALSSKDGAYNGKTADEWKKEWENATSDINALKTENEKLKDSLRDDVYWRDFERAHESVQNYADTLSEISSMISDDMLFNSNGELTEFGVSKIAILTEEYENAQKEIRNCYNDIENLNKLYAEGQYSEKEYNQKFDELQKSLLKSVSSAKSASDDIIKMYKSINEKELESINKLIDARSKALSAKKEYYDYDKTLKDKTKDVQTLQAQIAALEGVDSAEARAKKAKLNEELQNAQDDLDETVFNHKLELSQNALSDLKDTLQESFDDKFTDLSSNLSEIKEIIEGMSKYSDENANQADSAIKNLLLDLGLDISGVSKLIFDSFNSDSDYNFEETIDDAVKNEISKLVSSYLDSLGNFFKSFKTDKSYATGTKSVPYNMRALTNEDGKDEIIVTKKGMITPLSKGDGVIPHDLTERLYELAKSNPVSHNVLSIPDGLLNSIGQINVPQTNINQHYDSLINIEGSADAATVEDLKAMSKDLLEESYKYTSQKIFKGYKIGGGRRQV